MYTLTKKELGNRLKQIRQFLSITQIELKEILNCNQVSISRMEAGQGGSAELYIKALCYYSNYIYIDALFQENFQIVSIDSKDRELFKSNVTSMASNIISKAISTYQESLKNLATEFSNNFEKEIDKLNRELDTQIKKTSKLLSPN